MLLHLRVLLEMGADQEGSLAALQLERQLPMYFEVRARAAKTALGAYAALSPHAFREPGPGVGSGVKLC